MTDKTEKTRKKQTSADSADARRDKKAAAQNEALRGQEALKKLKELGGRKGPEPTRFGDWEKDGKCVDF